MPMEKIIIAPIMMGKPTRKGIKRKPIIIKTSPIIVYLLIGRKYFKKLII
jgi:hypothetical protein